MSADPGKLVTCEDASRETLVVLVAGSQVQTRKLLLPGTSSVQALGGAEEPGVEPVSRISSFHFASASCEVYFSLPTTFSLSPCRHSRWTRKPAG